MATLRNVLPSIRADMAAGTAVILKSPPGVGKTDVTNNGVFNMLKAMHSGKRVGMCRSFMAYQDSVDAGGLPWKAERTYGDRTYTITDPAMPTWYISTEGKPACEYDIVLMVFEEWGQGGVDTKKAFAPILLEGGVGQYRLPEGSPRIALTNVDSRDGVTKELDFVIGRRAEYDIVGSVPVWIEDFADKPYKLAGREWLTMGVTKTWASQNPQIMFEDKPKKQGPWCNPRTLCMADRYLQGMAEASHGVIPIEDPLLVEGLAGKIGMAATRSYINTLRIRLELPSYEDVVMNPDETPVPSKPDLQMLMAYQLAERAIKDDLAPLIKYMSRLPKDYSLTFVTSLLRRAFNEMVNEPAMKAYIQKNAILVNMLVSMS